MFTQEEVINSGFSWLEYSLGLGVFKGIKK